VRNCVAVGADPARIAILDNFCWGDCERPQTLGSLVRAALACRDLAIALGTPFISGKDSLNNEFSYVDESGARRTIAIPPSLLISALGQIDDVSRAVTMDLKSAGNQLYIVGGTKAELGGSHYALVESLTGGRVPEVDPQLAKRTFAALHKSIDAGLVRACHDLSEGGLAVGAAEMAFAGGLGAKINIDRVPCSSDATETAVLLFSESNTRFLCEVEPAQAAAFEEALAGVPCAAIGEVTLERILTIEFQSAVVVDAEIDKLKEAWQAPLAW
jgi:phosphoribosylformylglycinamidine synthase